MMYPRLMLLKELLREDGVIFVCIDDNEVANLRLLMDEVFDESNFIATIVWQKRTSPEARTILGAAHDYIVVYAKSKPNVRLNQIAFDEATADDFKNPDNDPKGPWASTDLTGQTGHATQNQFYSITTPIGVVYDPPPGRCWALAETTFFNLMSAGRIWFGKSGDARPRLKRYLSDMDTAPVWTWWTNQDVGHNQEATQNLNDIMGTSDTFSSPKPVRLIRQIVQIATEEGGNDIVLDSFAGSGTTGQAVMELNAEDSGHRNFILIQQPYDTKANEHDRFNICKNVTAERVRRVVRGYTYTGKLTETLLEEKVGLNTLKKAEALLERIEAIRQGGQTRFDQVKSEMKNGIIRVEGVKNNAEQKPGLGGTFTYTRVSAAPLFGEFRDLGDHLPAYNELARYIFFTETSRQWQAEGSTSEAGRIGEHSGVSYYLLYKPNAEEDWGIDLSFLRLAAEDPNKNLVVYCEMIRLHRDDLRRWQAETGKTIRSMIIPYNLK